MSERERENERKRSFIFLSLWNPDDFGDGIRKKEEKALIPLLQGGLSLSSFLLYANAQSIGVLIGTYSSFL